MKKYELTGGDAEVRGNAVVQHCRLCVHPGIRIRMPHNNLLLHERWRVWGKLRKLLRNARRISGKGAEDAWGQ